MQYQVTCKHCQQLFVVDSKPASTVHAKCPYCGTVSTIATPIAAQQQGFKTTSVPNKTSAQPASVSVPRRKHRNTTSLTRRVVLWFIVLTGLVIISAAILYAVFSHLSA